MKLRFLGLAIGLAACTGEPATGPTGPDPLSIAAIISDPVNSPAHGPATAYVSLPRGTLQEGVGLEIRNTRTGALITAPLVLGGFDPVAIAAQVGDVLAFHGVGGAVVTPRPKVPPRRPPMIVRTDPPLERRDVPLNATLRVVFSEPIDPGSLSSTAITLTQLGTPVPGTVRLHSSDLK